MPIFRGLEISVVASTDGKNLPEYPHPDGSSVRLLSPEDARINDSQSSHRPSESSILSDADPTRQKKFNPRISVYIPSMPGKQFWVRYTVLRIAPPATHLFFKMYMNGRLITSWGILARTDDCGKSPRPVHGTVVRALYEPGERWNDKGTGIKGRAVGIEARYFHFMPAIHNRSVAEDGGLIEIQVFRSKGRRRRAPMMAEFRSQGHYGIASPSGGLVENPQDTTYYDWLLIDPKDSPYASFHFHYRSMENLLQLNLIPQSESNLLLPVLDESFFSDHGTPVGHEETLDDQSPDVPMFTFDDDTFGSNAPSNGSGGVVDQAAIKIAQRARTSYLLQNLPELHPATVVTQDITQPCKSFREVSVQELVVDRPLPFPPRPKARSSQSSLRSSCPSLTPSVANYVNDGTFGEDEVSIGTAHTVICSAPSMVDLPERRLEAGEDSSMSDYRNSPPSSIVSLPMDRPSPHGYMSTTGSVLEQHISQYSSPLVQPSPRRVRLPMPLSTSESAPLEDPIVLQPGVFELSESEWMQRTPSPALRKPIGRLWSPRLEKKPIGLSPDQGSCGPRYSDLGPRTLNEASGDNDVGSEPVSYDAATYRIAREASDESLGPHPFRAKESHTSVKIDTTTEYSQRNTWEACREYQYHDYMAAERPPGNWI